jgi:hypothetical protein
MRVYVKGTGKEVNLNQRDFVAQGGEGKIFAHGGMAYKVYHDPAHMIPVGKIQELAAITDPRVIRPQHVLTDKRGKPIGYTTRFVRDATALCQLFPKSFRERESVSHEMVQKLVRQLQHTVTDVHRAGILVVDLNEMNFLVTRNFQDLYAIDVDSYQTPHYKATAIMESIRDWTVSHHQWTENSDWFSFAVVTFQMFTGIHPFKGMYRGSNVSYRKKLTSDDPNDCFAVTRRRMVDHVSVFDPNVKVPAAIYPYDVIPAAYRAWYEALFTKGDRCAPPTDFTAAIIILPTVKTVTGTDQLEIIEIGNYEGGIKHLWSDGNKLVVVTDKGVWLDHNRVAVAGAKTIGACAVTPRGGRFVVMDRQSNPPLLFNVTDRQPVDFLLEVDETASCDGRIYVRSGEHVYEVVMTDMGNTVVASTKTAVNVVRHASKLYPGVVVQSLLGSVYVSLLTAPGVAHQVRIKELDEYRVLEAKYDGGVLMVVGTKGGKYDRLIFRFASDNTYDIRKVEDITPTGLNFVTLDSGVCVCLTEEEKLELFSAKRGSTAVKVVEDKALSGDMILGKKAGTLLFARGDKVYTMRMKP